jgi:DUF4097 and DUF4098 domain-containing protein YvlB
MDEFTTPKPVRLRIEFGAGDVKIDATDTPTSTVRIEPHSDNDASREAVERTTVEQRGDEIRIETPRKSSFLRRAPMLSARITVPIGSSVEAKLDSADLHADGEYEDAMVKSGSGDIRLDTVRGETSAQSGSGDITVMRAQGRTRAEAGSGEIRLRVTEGAVKASTGSGDIRLDEAHDQAQVNSGSGEIQVGDAHADLSVNTASGDQQIGRTHRGRVQCNAASGDISIGIADGTAAWLDVNSISGSVNSQLEGSEPPGEGEETVQVKANTVSGDITLSRA